MYKKIIFISLSLLIIIFFLFQKDPKKDIQQKVNQLDDTNTQHITTLKQQGVNDYFTYVLTLYVNAENVKGINIDSLKKGEFFDTIQTDTMKPSTLKEGTRLYRTSDQSSTMLVAETEKGLVPYMVYEEYVKKIKEN